MPPTLPLTALCDATIFTGEAWVEDHALLTRGGHVVDIIPNHRIPADAHKTSYPDLVLAPGLIDAQVNGGGNILFNNTPTAESCLAIARAHRAYGTTHILPTCITDTAEITAKAITASREARKQDSGILGIHIEGPHIATDARGVHKAEHIRGLSDQELSLYQRESDEVMMITVAPETVPPEQIKVLHQQGAIISLGHTKALPEQIHLALEAGATGFTHLYNGMGGLNARAPGPAGVALDDRQSWCSLIADGHHVAPAMIRLAMRAKPPGKVFLVSDAMPPSATTTPQTFQLYDETIHAENGRCVNAEGKLAGAAITLSDAVRHCVRVIGIDLDEALRMASTYPAAFLGVGKKLGKLLPGFEASIVTIDSHLTIKPVD